MEHVFSNDSIDFSQYEKETAPSMAIRTPDSWREEILNRVRGGNPLTGDLLPWSKTHNLVAFRPTEVTVWAGPNGAGKSILTSFVQLGFSRDGAKCCVASFEMPPVETLMRNARQTANSKAPTEADVNRFFKWSENKMYVYDHVGRVDVVSLCAAIRYAAKVLKVEHFFVDNLMMCVRGEDDYNGQKDFMEQMGALAKELKIHIHIVAHVKKPDEKSFKKRLTRYDIKGSGAISDLPEQIIMVYRNESKEKQVEECLANDETPTPELLAMPDVFANLDKQRNGTGWTGLIALWFDMGTGQYRGAPNANAIDFIGGGNV